MPGFHCSVREQLTVCSQEDHVHKAHTMYISQGYIYFFSRKLTIIIQNFWFHFFIFLSVLPGLFFFLYVQCHIGVVGDFSQKEHEGTWSKAWHLVSIVALLVTRCDRQQLLISYQINKCFVNFKINILWIVMIIFPGWTRASKILAFSPTDVFICGEFRGLKKLHVFLKGRLRILNTVKLLHSLFRIL